MNGLIVIAIGNVARLLIVLCVANVSAVAGQSAHPPVNDFVQTYFGQLKTLEAKFEQKSIRSRMGRDQILSGTLYIKRPGRFRWDYNAPYEQNIVSNGAKVWLYDVDLEQVTIKRLDTTVGVTPALLLSDDKALKEGFHIRTASKTAAMDWFSLTPRQSEEASFQEVRLGFERDVIRKMILVDHLDQTTEISFDKVKTNTGLSNSLFDFTPPEGVDIIEDVEPTK